MTQFPGSQAPLHGAVPADNETSSERDPMEELIPSAGDSSGMPPAVRQALDAQVRAAGGKVDQLVHALRARIAQIDGSPVTEDGSVPQALQAERALYVAQVSYLEDHVAGYRVEDSGTAPEAAPGGTLPGQSRRASSRRARVYPTGRG